MSQTIIIYVSFIPIRHSTYNNGCELISQLKEQNFEVYAFSIDLMTF